MDRPRVAVLLPTAYRPEWLRRCLISLFESEGTKPDMVVVSPFSDDAQSLQVCREFNVTTVKRRPDQYQLGSVFGWNVCFPAAAQCDFIMDCGDDVVFRDNWLDNGLAAAEKFGRRPVLVGLNDGIADLTVYAAHWLASFDFLQKFVGGCTYPPLYKTWWCDRELSDIAIREGCYVPCLEARIEHLHHSLHLAPIDETYRRAMPNYDIDERLYLKRKKLGFPITWEPMVNS